MHIFSDWLSANRHVYYLLLPGLLYLYFRLDSHCDLSGAVTKRALVFNGYYVTSC